MNQPLCTVPVNAKSSFMTVETRSMCSPLGARFDNYLLLLHDQSIYMFRPSFFPEAYILDALKIQEKNFDMMRIGCRVITDGLLFAL